MASVYKEFIVQAPLTQVWDALRDYNAVHQRLAPGFVVDCRAEEGARVVTFANGQVAREVLVAIDETHHRLSYTVVGGKAAHHNASAQLVADGPARTRFIWITDVLPDAFAPYVDSMMEQGGQVMQRTLARASAVSSA